VAVFGSFRFGQYFEDLLTGVVAAARAAGSSVISVQTSAGVLASSDERGAQDAVNRAAWDHFDGAIVILQSVSLDYVARLRAAGKFVVAIGQDLRGTHSAVAIDNPGGVRAAISHLAEHGHTAIGFLSPTWQVDTAERYTAYCEQMTALGLVARPLLSPDLPAELSMDEQGYLGAAQFMAGDRSCTAVMVGTDLIALGFMRGLQEAGVSIPGDVALVGMDDVAEAAVSTPALATVAISFKQAGEIAFDVASRGGSGEAMDVRYLVPERFVPRESCGCPTASAAVVPGAKDERSDVEVFADALAEAAADGHLGQVPAADPVQVAAAVVRSLASRPAAAELADLAAQVNELCLLDRSVQAALRAVRSLAQALAEDQATDPRQAGVTWSTALDLCDAIRSGQLQRRMAEYVDLKRMQMSHYFIGNSLLSHDRDELRALGWLQQTPAQSGALGLWSPTGQTDRLAVQGQYHRKRTAAAADPGSNPATAVPVESFPPPWMLRSRDAGGHLVVIVQVRFEDSDWGLLAVAGGRILQSCLVQETFQQWSILMSASLDQERANADLAEQAAQLIRAHETEMALLEEVRVSEQRYALAAEAAQDALWDWDIATGQVFYSSQWKALLGYRDHEVGPDPQEWLGRVHLDDEGAVRGQVNRVLSGAEQFIDTEHRLRSATGEFRWISCSGRSVVDEHGRPTRIVGSVTDITVRRLLQEQLRQEAFFDGLTGLAKGAPFKDQLNQAVELSRRQPELRFAVLFIDLDGFKAVNDAFGHAAGDELLAAVAARLKDSLRREDAAARLGGDEFAVLLHNVGPAREVAQIVRRMEALIRAPYVIAGHTVSVGAAIGVAVSDAGYRDGDAMLHDADTDMYRVKRAHKAARRAGPPGGPPGPAAVESQRPVKTRRPEPLSGV